MLFSERSVGLHHAQARVYRLLHHACCARVTAVDGATLEEALMVPRIGRGIRSRSRVAVFLAGRGQLRVNERVYELRPGVLYAHADLGACISRLESGSRIIQFDCDANLFRRGREQGIDVSSVRIDRFHELAQSMCTGPAEARADTAIRLVRYLRAEGTPLEPLCLTDLVDEKEARFESISRAMDRILSTLPALPMSVDLADALDCSRRTVVRWVDAYHAHFGIEGIDARSFRAALRYWRLASAAILLTGAGATTEDVAQAVGFGGPEALCHAFAQVSLPSPQRIRQAVSDLA